MDGSIGRKYGFAEVRIAFSVLDNWGGPLSMVMRVIYCRGRVEFVSTGVCISAGLLRFCGGRGFKIVTVALVSDSKGAREKA